MSTNLTDALKAFDSGLEIKDGIISYREGHFGAANRFILGLKRLAAAVEETEKRLDALEAAVQNLSKPKG